jgi:hypothetical protein
MRDLGGFPVLAVIETCFGVLMVTKNPFRKIFSDWDLNSLLTYLLYLSPSDLTPKTKLLYRQALLLFFISLYVKCISDIQIQLRIITKKAQVI